MFAEPWQANAFALAVKLSEQGYFTWKEWTTALADDLKAAADRGEPDDGSRYYDHWVATLERLVVVKGLTDQEALVARKEAWTKAYRILRMAPLWSLRDRGLMPVGRSLGSRLRSQGTGSFNRRRLVPLRNGRRD